MRSVRTALLALSGTLLVGLAVSLVTANSLSRELHSFQSEYITMSDQLEEVVSQRDTLANVHLVFHAREDSLLKLTLFADSIGALMELSELERNYTGFYLLIDTRQNRFHLRRSTSNGEDILVRSGYCGTGKGWTENELGQVWDFSTPRGLRYVRERGENPYWYRPDWYWEEMNLTPPEPEDYVVIPDTLSWEEQIVYYHDSLSAGERIWVQRVPGALGSYKIDLGGGILIHYGVGRGRNVSHGCIRMGSGDLEALYRALPVGAPVVIY